jgi:glycosyltransferase involved in cell wall biosynthesis
VKVVHVITGLGQGGAEAMLENLVLAGRRADPQVEQSVVCLGRLGVVGERLLRAGISVESLGLGTVTPAALPRLYRLAAALKGPVIVQTWLWHADLLGGLCARMAGNPRIVWNIRNSMPDLASTKRSSRLVARLCARLSAWLPARIVCNSGAALRAHTAIGYDRTRCVVVPNGFDLRRFVRSESARASLRAQWGIGLDELLVGMVARVDPQKDHATFIRAAADVATTMPQVRFVLIGAGVTAATQIAQLLHQLALQDRFLLVERREDVQDVMSALDLFCLASRSEGFPNVIGEAMACATPAVGTDAGDSREIIADERLVAPVGDAAALAACMRCVLTLSPEERGALGSAQRDSVAARFDIERVWRMYRDLYAAL